MKFRLGDRVRCVAEFKDNSHAREKLLHSKGTIVKFNDELTEAIVRFAPGIWEVDPWLPLDKLELAAGPVGTISVPVGLLRAGDIVCTADNADNVEFRITRLWGEEVLPGHFVNHVELTSVSNGARVSWSNPQDQDWHLYVKMLGDPDPSHVNQAKESLQELTS